MDAIKHPKTLPKFSHFRSHFSLYRASVNLQFTGKEGVQRSGASEGNRKLYTFKNPINKFLK
tara:strand:+ start:384 stop:569 length:186 start_codon:yes stop_codon:yes gene_type:complete